MKARMYMYILQKLIKYLINKKMNYIITDRYKLLLSIKSLIVKKKSQIDQLTYLYEILYIEIGFILIFS